MGSTNLTRLDNITPVNPLSAHLEPETQSLELAFQTIDHLPLPDGPGKKVANEHKRLMSLAVQYLSPDTLTFFTERDYKPNKSRFLESRHDILALSKEDLSPEAVTIEFEYFDQYDLLSAAGLASQLETLPAVISPDKTALDFEAQISSLKEKVTVFMNTERCIPLGCSVHTPNTRYSPRLLGTLSGLIPFSQLDGLATQSSSVMSSYGIYSDDMSTAGCSISYSELSDETSLRRSMVRAIIKRAIARVIHLRASAAAAFEPDPFPGMVDFSQKRQHATAVHEFSERYGSFVSFGERMFFVVMIPVMRSVYDAAKYDLVASTAWAHSTYPTPNTPL